MIYIFEQYDFFIALYRMIFIALYSMMLGVKRPRLSFIAALSDGGAHKSEREGKQTSARTPASIVIDRINT